MTIDKVRTYAYRYFRKPTRPSLPLRKAPPLISVFFNGLYTPFGSPVCGGQKPQARRRKPPSGARNRYALRLADHQRSSPCCAGWDRLGYTLIGKVCTFFELLQYSILFNLVLYLFLRTTCPAKNFLSYLFPLRQLRLSEICFPDVFPLIVIQ